MEAEQIKGKLGGYLMLIGGIVITIIFTTQFFNYFSITNWEVLWRLIWLYLAKGFLLFAAFAGIKRLNKIAGLIGFIENFIIGIITFFLVFEMWNISWYSSWEFYMYLWGYFLTLIGSILGMMKAGWKPQYGVTVS